MDALKSYSGEESTSEDEAKKHEVTSEDEAKDRAVTDSVKREEDKSVRVLEMVKVEGQSCLICRGRAVEKRRRLQLMKNVV